MSLFKKNKPPQLNTSAPRYLDWVSLLAVSPHKALLEAPAFLRNQYKATVYSINAPLNADTALHLSETIVQQYTFTKDELAAIHPKVPSAWSYYSVYNSAAVISMLKKLHTHWTAPAHYVGSYLEPFKKATIRKEIYIKQVKEITSISEQDGTVDVNGEGYLLVKAPKNKLFQPSITTIKTQHRFTELPIAQVDNILPGFSLRISAAMALGLVGESLNQFVLHHEEQNAFAVDELPLLNSTAASF